MISSDAVNPNTIAELCQTMGSDFMVDLVSSFLLDVPAQIDALIASYASDDSEAFRRAAHSIKSTSLYFGAEQLSAQARLLEEKGKSGQLEGCMDEIALLKEFFSAVQTQLKELGYE